MTIQRLASELIRCSCKECGQANLIRTHFAEVEQQNLSGPVACGQGTGPSAPPPFLHL